MKIQYKKELHVYEDDEKNKNRLLIPKFKYCCKTMEDSEFVNIQTYANSVKSYIREKGQTAYNHDMEECRQIVKECNAYLSGYVNYSDYSPYINTNITLKNDLLE